MQTQRSSVAKLVAQIPRVAEDDPIGPEGQKLARAIWNYGGAAVPLLLPYLKHPRTGVRNLTGRILRDCPGLTPAHLPGLMNAAKGGRGWLPPAIARIGTPQAVTFLVEQLTHGEHDHDQLCYAIGTLGTKAVRPLCHLLRTADPKHDLLFLTVSDIFANFDSATKKLSVQPLLHVAQDSAVPIPNRKGTIRALGNLGSPAIAFVPDLKALAQRDATFVPIVEEALVALGALESVPGLLRSLAQSKEYDRLLVFRDLASIGTNGRSAGPTVTTYLQSDDWDTRLHAARTLGFIGYRAAVPELITALSNKDDWRLVRVAAESLGRLRADEARPALEKVAKEHWYPSVRKVARDSLAHISAREPYPDGMARGKRDFSYTFYKWRRIDKVQLPSPPSALISDRLDVSNGVLAGTDDGEWGGELTFTPIDGSSKQRLLPRNISVITRIGADGPVVAVGGLAHLSLNYGILYRVVQDNHGTWKVRPWKALPGAPRWAVAAPPSNNETSPRLRIACYGGVVDVAQDGTIFFTG